MDEFYLRCKKCRASLCSSECLVTPKGEDYKTDYYAEDCHASLWFLNPNNHPVWVAIAVREGDYVKGKLKCPKCEAKLGAFDYVSANICSCGEHQTGSAWLVKSKVDFTRTISIPSSRRASTPVPMVTENTGSQSHGLLNGFTNTERRGSMPGNFSPCLPRGSPQSGSFPRSRSRPMAIPANIRIEMEDSDGSDSLSNSPYSAVVGFFDSVYSSSNHSNADVEAGDLNNGSIDFSADLGNDLEDGKVMNVFASDNSSHEAEECLNVPVSRNTNRENEEENKLSLGHSVDSVAASHSGSEGSDVDVSTEKETAENVMNLTGCDLLSDQRADIIEPQCVEDDESQNCEKIPDVRDIPKDLVDAYTCSICLEVYFEPHTCQPCRHVFCSPCLRRLNRSSNDFSTKCPLCRKVISLCQLNEEMDNLVTGMFPEEISKRKCVERKGHDKLSPLPNFKNHLLPPVSRRSRHWNRNTPRGSFVLAHWAGVCFVVMLMMLGICILATTVAVCAWYLWEVCVDVVIEIAVNVNRLFDNIWQAFAGLLPEGNITPEMAKLLAGSFGQLLHAIGRLFNGSEIPLESGVNGGSLESQEANPAPFLTDAQQADIANYFLVCGLMTYMIYRLAKFCQARREEAIHVEHEEVL